LRFNPVRTTKSYDPQLLALDKKVRSVVRSKIHKFSSPVEFLQACRTQGASRHNLMILEMLVRDQTLQHISNLLLFPPHLIHWELDNLLSFIECLKTKRFIDVLKEYWQPTK